MLYDNNSLSLNNVLNQMNAIMQEEDTNTDQKPIIKELPDLPLTDTKLEEK